MEKSSLVKVSDYHSLAVLDAHRISPLRTERNGRFYCFFRSDEAQSILTEYESGTLVMPVRDFVAALGRVKTRIFESERAQNGAGYVYQSSQR